MRKSLGIKGFLILEFCFGIFFEFLSVKTRSVAEQPASLNNSLEQILTIQHFIVVYSWVGLTDVRHLDNVLLDVTEAASQAIWFYPVFVWPTAGIKWVTQNEQEVAHVGNGTIPTIGVWSIVDLQRPNTAESSFFQLWKVAWFEHERIWPCGHAHQENSLGNCAIP
jgi:hypothetical protein